MGGEGAHRSLSVGVGGSQGEHNAYTLTLTGNSKAVFNQGECSEVVVVGGDGVCGWEVAA